MMDDLQMVRDLLPAAPPPAAEVTGAARARMMAAVAGEAPGRPGSWHRRAGRRLAMVPRWRLAVPVLAVTAAAAVTAALLAGGGTGAPTAKLTARDVLLMAATAAAAAPSAGTGKYVVQEWVSGELIAAGPNSHPYVTERRNDVSATWWPTTRGTYANYLSVNYTSRLPTPGATAAWRADGSPPLPQQSGKSPQVSTGPASLSFGNEALTVAQFRALPSSTAGLEEAIVKALHAKAQPNEGEGPGGDRGIINTCVGLLLQDPITPAVRAAAFRILATMPGISLIGQVTDPLGRAGYSITFPDWLGGISVATGDSAKAQYQLIISSSGSVLASEYVTAAPSTSLVAVMPASGAIPGPASCGANQRQMGNQCFDVLQTPAPPNRGLALGGPVFTLGTPILAVPAGMLIEYQAYLSSGLTNATPSATIPSLPPVAATSSSASASPPSQSPSPATSSPVTAPATPSQSPSASSAAPSQSASTPVPTQSPSKT